MNPSANNYYHRASAPFTHAGEELFVEVIDDQQTVRRCRWPSKDVIEQTVCPLTRAGCHIETFAVSPSGEWVATERISGQGEWGYDVFRTCPLTLEAGSDERRGYISGVPRFAADESRLMAICGHTLDWWWPEPDAANDEPAPGGLVGVGWLIVHRLPSHEKTHHELVVDLPRGWKSDNPRTLWRMPKDATPVGEGVRLVPSGGVVVEIAGPLPEVIGLPPPHPSGHGFL